VTSANALRLGTRGSLLALAQSRWVADRIQATSGRTVELVTIRTTGDLVQDRPLAEIGGKGLFTRELDDALLDGRVDLAVHSLKDLPTILPEGLALAAIPEREDPRDALVGPEGSFLSLQTLPRGARVGTGSLRRQALALAHRPDLRMEGIRGNLDTRIGKVDGGEFAAIILAAAGLRRLGWQHRISEALDVSAWPPAPGQGALAILVRDGEEGIAEGWVGSLSHPPTAAAVIAERSLLHELEAGCRLPVAAMGLSFQGGLRLRAMVLSPDGRKLVRGEATGSAADAEGLGRRLASILLGRGAGRILDEVRAAAEAAAEAGG
jgi:hydroxymethylbilane synthase